jgi:hypothetical protein
MAFLTLAMMAAGLAMGFMCHWVNSHSGLFLSGVACGVCVASLLRQTEEISHIGSSGASRSVPTDEKAA